MELGARLKEARLEAGLSQRQLCGDVISRNMLSQIENGSARPSMDTLRYLASRLGKSIGYFLEEEAEMSPREKRLTGHLEKLAAAETALKNGKTVYAGELLDNMEILDSDYCAGELNRKRLLLLAKAYPQRRRDICRQLPDLDEELLLRARDALERGIFDQSAALLDAASNRESPEWNLLRGDVYLAVEQFSEAARCYHRAEEGFPDKTAPRLERCYREMEDFRQAYFYACRQR